MKPAKKEEVPIEVSEESLAKQITEINAACAKLVSSGLNRQAIIALVHDDTGLPKRVIDKILGSLGSLRAKYTSL